ncbi:hypothetical protein DPX16_8049 [Anabarilius grahami]|uniref:Uncharacterized protein n=1 Tax=Anabarilius grahami TaxID=495550 RepID=A0A3N0XXM5_ANAGA|nr:hypothetical protein DPX16_8049 [Anabarilius grahami]
MHSGSFDSGPVCQPEPAAVPERPALLDTATEAPWSALPAPPKLSALLPLPRPSDPLKPACSVPPAPPWHSARTLDLLEPAWSVPPALPWHSAQTLDLLEPAWFVPPAPPWHSTTTLTWLEPQWSVPLAPPWPSVALISH